MITARLLDDRSGFRHGFFTRRGGSSDGIYASLNCGFGSADRRAAVAENRARVARALDGDPANLVTVHQIHGTTVAVVERPWEPADSPKADAMVTATPGIVIGVLAADCAPVLLADAEAGVVGAAHAGWKGALGGVVEAAVAAMERLGARRERIAAAIGPCIGPASYEVGPEFQANFDAADAENRRFFVPGTGDRRYFDLPGYLRARIVGLGLAGVELLAHDTLPATEDFFSYRRSCLVGEPDYGRQVSAITLI